MRARDSGRLTSARATPGTAATARSTRRTHAAQVMPRTGRSIVVSAMRCYRRPVITTLRITGMTCNGCVRHVDQALRGVPGVSSVEVSLANGTAKVVHDESAALPAMVAAVESAGYEAAA